MSTRREFLAQLAALSGAAAVGRVPRAAGCHSLLLGEVSSPDGAPLAGARVMLLDEAGALVSEARSGPAGAYSLDVYQSGTYRLAASAPGRSYRQLALGSVTDCGGEIDAPELILADDVQPGRWARAGDMGPEPGGVTDSATVLADGRILFGRDTVAPILFDPVTGARAEARGSGTAQSGYANALLPDGRVIFVGGHDGDDAARSGNAVAWVRVYDSAGDAWERWPDLDAPRWRPTLTRLPGGRLLVAGGGRPADARRADTAEVIDPSTRRATPTGRLLSPADLGPAVMLLDGRVLRSWWPPQVWDPGDGAWRATGPFVPPERGDPGPCSHRLALLPDGRAAAVGMAKAGVDTPSMLALFDPRSDSWSPGPTPATLRSGPRALLLPDGRMLAAGGHKEVSEEPGETDRWGAVALADLYDPLADAWRVVAPIPVARATSALGVLAPDGRVIVTAGTVPPGEGDEGTDDRVDAYEPPYLFRGPRPVIGRLGATELIRGESFSLGFSNAVRPTAVVLVGLNAVTGFVDGGAGRLVRLPFRQDGATLTVSVPDDPFRLPEAYYLLFLMVDDVPSVGRVVRVDPPPDTPTSPPGDASRRRVYLPWSGSWQP